MPTMAERNTVMSTELMRLNHCTLVCGMEFRM